MGLALVAFLVGVSLAGARAETGLQRFESQIKPQLEFKKFTYGTASTLGDKGFVLNDVVAVVPGTDATQGKDTTVKIEKVTVEEVDFDRLKKEGHNSDDVPRFVKLRIDGMEGDEVLSGMLVPYGVPKAPVDLALDYRLDTDKKVLTISAIEFGLRGEGKIKLGLVLDGVSDKASEVMGGAKDSVRLRIAELVVDNTGLIAKVLPAIAQQQGATAEALVAVAVAPIASFAAGQGPATLKALDAVVSFIGDWKTPKAPIRLTITPVKGVSFNDLEKISQSNALVDIFGLSVDYPGTRPGAASAGAATGGGSATATATPDTGTKAAPVTGTKAAPHVTGAINWPGGKAQFFLSDGTYVRYDIEADRVDSGYPKPVNDKTWPGMGRYGSDIAAAANGLDPNKAYFFLSDGTYLRYDIAQDSVDQGYPKQIDDGWSGLGRYAKKLVAALNWPNHKIQFFVSDGTYIRYDLQTDRVDEGYPKRIDRGTWPGLSPYASSITTAINWRNGKAYFFLDDGRYFRYDIGNDAVDSGYPKNINASTWPGLYEYFRHH